MQALMHNRIISICLFSVLYISCSPVKEEIAPITEITPLKKDTVFYTQDRAYVDMMISDSLLLFIANKDSNYVHVFNKVSLDSLISFGKKGNAGFEFNHVPLFVKQYYEDKDYIEAFDLFSMKTINIKNIIEGKNISGEIKFERMDEKLAFSREIVRIDNNTLVGTSLNRSDGLFYIYHNKNKKWVPHNPKLKIDKKAYGSVYYGLIETSPDSETIVYCPRYFDRILFFDRDGKLKKTLNFSEIKIPKIGEKYLGVSNEETIYSLQTYRTNSFLYVLRPLQSLKYLMENRSPIEVQILCLTWNGNIHATYELILKNMSTLFCIDEENNKILFNTPIDSYLSNDIITEISIYDIKAQ
jgi:hypothetical protein